MENQNSGYSGREEIYISQKRKQLPEADINYFRKYNKDFVAEDWYWGFTCFSRQNYKNDIMHSFEDEVIYGVYSHEGGCMSEMTMRWEKLGNVVVPYLKSFSESFLLVTSPMHRKIFACIRKWHKELFSSEDFSQLLIALGFQDNSDFLIEYSKNRN